MKTKYYTPEEKELHIGFTYERKNRNTKAYQEFTISNEDELKVCVLICEELRVKHLDRDDIESLGFSLGYSSWDRKTNEREVIIMEPWKDVSEKMQFELVINEQNVWQVVFGKTIQIIHATLSVDKIGFMILGEPLKEPKHYMKFNTVFNGTIKNKSEFKRILRQIGVEVE